jgi:hypothetical protein
MDMAADEIYKYVEGARAASDRVRFVLLILVTASILAFSAFWNSRESGWVRQRLHLARVGLQMCSAVKDPQYDGPNFDDPSKLLKEDIPLVAEARAFYFRRHYHSCENLRFAVRDFEKIMTEDIGFVHVPFFGFGFDINDLGMLSGIAFVVMMMWLRLSLESEFRCVKMTFDRAKEIDGPSSPPDTLAHARRLLGMHQVFTHVPGVSAESADNGTLTGGSDKETGEKKKKRRRYAFLVTYFSAWGILVGYVITEALNTYSSFRPNWSLVRVLADLIIVVIAVSFLREVKSDLNENS